MSCVVRKSKPLFTENHSLMAVLDRARFRFWVLTVISVHNLGVRDLMSWSRALLCDEYQ